MIPRKHTVFLICYTKKPFCPPVIPFLLLYQLVTAFFNVIVKYGILQYQL